MFRTKFTAIIVLGVSVLNSQAATVTPQSGTVHINAGAGFIEVPGDTIVAPAAKVMVSPGGSALVTYSDDCSVRLASGVWTIQEQAPCKQGVAMIDFTNRMNQAAPPTADPGFNTTTLVVGGLIAGGIVAGTAMFAINANDQPESP